MKHQFRPDTDFTAIAEPTAWARGSGLVEMLRDRDVRAAERPAAAAPTPVSEADLPTIEPAPALDVDALVAAAAAEARTAALADLENQATAALARAADAVVRAVEAEREARAAERRHDVEQVLALVRTVARHVLPAAAARVPLDDLAASLEDLLGRLEQQPQLQIRVATEVAKGLADRLAEITSAAGFTGQVEVASDPSLAIGDAVVRWPSGRAERRLEDLVEAAETLLAAWLAAPAAEPPSPSADERTDQ
jgi:flagellar assembly protein FliH